MRKRLKILLTGASGNLGSHIAGHALSSGIEVIPVSRGEWKSVSECSDRIDAVVHCAADIKSKISYSPKLYLNSNLDITVDILEFCADRNIKKFYFTSSAAIYGHSLKTNEGQKKQPSSLNGFIKSLNEELIENFCEENQISFTIFRIFNLYGGDDQFSIITKLIQAAQNGYSFNLINNGSTKRDFVHVDDVADIICRVLRIGSCPEFLNIGTGQPTKISDILSSVENKYGSIRISNSFFDEPEISIADTKLLRQVLGDISFRNVFDEINHR